MRLYWSEEKDSLVQSTSGRGGLGFRDVEIAISKGGLVNTTISTKGKYAGQIVLFVNIDTYIRVIPCVRYQDGLFMKTMFPSRKATKKYLYTK